MLLALSACLQPTTPPLHVADYSVFGPEGGLEARVVLGRRPEGHTGPLGPLQDRLGSGAHRIGRSLIIADTSIAWVRDEEGRQWLRDTPPAGVVEVPVLFEGRTGTLAVAEGATPPLPGALLLPCGAENRGMSWWLALDGQAALRCVGEDPERWLRAFSLFRPTQDSPCLAALGVGAESLFEADFQSANPLDGCPWPARYSSPAMASVKSQVPSSP